MTHLKHSFPPISNEETEILILGTMPGDESLRKKEYYGHPSNRFWRVIAAIYGEETPILYGDKIALLLRNKIGIWDVIQQANRKGSLDTAIENEQPNDIATFLSHHKNLRLVAFNGKNAAHIFHKYFQKKEGINYIVLPSTSPANAKSSLVDLQQTWLQMRG